MTIEQYFFYKKGQKGKIETCGEKVRLRQSFLKLLQVKMGKYFYANMVIIFVANILKFHCTVFVSK